MKKNDHRVNLPLMQVKQWFPEWDKVKFEKSRGRARPTPSMGF